MISGGCLRDGPDTLVPGLISGPDSPDRWLDGLARTAQKDQERRRRKVQGPLSRERIRYRMQHQLCWVNMGAGNMDEKERIDCL